MPSRAKVCWCCSRTVQTFALDGIFRSQPNRERLLSGSDVLTTEEFRDIEYAVQGEGLLVLLAHGADLRPGRHIPISTQPRAAAERKRRFDHGGVQRHRICRPGRRSAGAARARCRPSPWTAYSDLNPTASGC